MSSQLVASVADGSPRARAELESRFASAWSAPDRAEGHELLDALASAAAASPHALEALITVLQTNRVAQPAIRRFIIDADDIDDIEQATMAQVALKVEQFDGRSKFATWVFTVAGNEAKMMLRSRQRRPQTGDAVPEIGYLARLSTILGQRDEIERALAALPEDLRAVLIAREVEQLDYDEIAAHLELPIGTVRSRLHRARSVLAAQLRTS